MKLRIENDRFIFRLGEEERTMLTKKRELSLSFSLPLRELDFTLKLDSTIDTIEMMEEANSIVVAMPQQYMDRWDEVRVGFEDEVFFSEDRSVRVIIEKDLKRSKKRDK
jgi:hypothetical protein